MLKYNIRSETLEKPRVGQIFVAVIIKDDTNL